MEPQIHRCIEEIRGSNIFKDERFHNVSCNSCLVSVPMQHGKFVPVSSTPGKALNLGVGTLYLLHVWLVSTGCIKKIVGNLVYGERSLSPVATRK